MKSQISNIEKYLKNSLQEYIHVVYNDKVIRRGTLTLYKIKDYNITLFLKTETTTKKYDLLYPFTLTTNPSAMHFNYKTIDLSTVHTSRHELLQDLIKKSTPVSKFVNNTIEIQRAPRLTHTNRERV